MRLGLSIPLPGPFRLSGTVWQSRRRRAPVSRFQHPLYWLTGLAFMEGMLWVMLYALAGELLATWWLLYAALNGVAWLVRRWWYVPESVAGAIAVCRPVWPSRETVQRRIAEGRPAD